jgi:hypothetical protein
MLARHTLVPDHTAFSWTPASNELKWRYVVYYCPAVYSNHSNQDQGAIFFTPGEPELWFPASTIAHAHNIPRVELGLSVNEI